MVFRLVDEVGSAALVPHSGRSEEMSYVYLGVVALLTSLQVALQTDPVQLGIETREGVEEEIGIEQAYCQFYSGVSSQLKPEQMRPLIEALGRPSVVVNLHEVVLSRPAHFECDVPAIRSLLDYFLALDKTCSDERREQIRSSISSFLVAIVNFDIHRGYLDTSVEPKSEVDNIRYRGLRSTALRLEALRALRAIYLEGVPESLLCKQEADRFINDYNPTEVARCRCDGRLKSKDNWAVAQRIEVTLFTSLLHFPSDIETMNFLAECCKKYDIDVALIEGALPTLVGLSVNELGRAEGEVRDKVVLALLEPNQQLAPPAECSETLKFVAENLRQLLNAARNGDYSSLPAARGKVPKSYVFNHLSRTRQRAIVLSLLAAKQLAVSTLDETPTEQIHENCYLRESFFDDWSFSKDSRELARFADSLDLLAVTWIARLEEGVNSIRDVDSLDDKAQLIASLLMTYQDLKTSASRRWRRSVEGLADRVNGNQSGSLDQRLREEALFVELVCEYQNKQTK